jgi:hypothetical protein
MTTNNQHPCTQRTPPLRPSQLTLRDVLTVVFGFAVGCGFLVECTSGEPSVKLASVLLLTWIGFAMWCLIAGGRRGTCLLQLVGGLSLLVLLGLCLVPLTPLNPLVGPRVQCNDNMKNIVLALLNYHDVYRRFPPAYIADKDGKPMHSWRVLLLPFLERKTLYDQYRFDEPWDGPHNSRLAAQMPSCYQCSASYEDSIRPPLTRYVAVVGPGTMWPGAASTKISDAVDGTDRTILVVESSDAPVHWMEPRDLDLQTLPLEINPLNGQGISSKHPGRAAHVAMVNGSVLFLSREKTTPQQLRALLTIAGGEPTTVP